MKTGKKYPFLFLLPYLLVFTVFIILPICVAVVLSFTDFNTVQMPNFVGFNNYINLANTGLHLHAVCITEYGYICTDCRTWRILLVIPACMGNCTADKSTENNISTYFLFTFTDNWCCHERTLENHFLR